MDDPLSVDFIESITVDLIDGIDAETLNELDRRLRETSVDARSPLKVELDKLDEDQASVVHDRSPILRVLAPAGAGKTQTQVNRVLSQIRDGQRPDRLLMVTFDRSGSNAIIAKLQEALTTSTNRLPLVFTLNAFGQRLLRDYFPGELSPLTDIRKSRSALRNLQTALARDRPDAAQLLPKRIRDRYYLDLFSYLKNELVDPRTCEAKDVIQTLVRIRPAEIFFEAGQAVAEQKLILGALSWLYLAMEKIYRRLELMDFDDQKLRALRCLRLDAQLAGRIQSQFDEIIVDEFQDINRLDFELIKTVAAKARLIVTGDDDQAIYGFRGCTPSYIIDLGKHLGREPKTIELRRNYRCPKNIVHHATRLIRNNTWRIEKSPIAARSQDAAIKVVSALGARIECTLAVSFIERVRKQNPDLSYKDFAVLYRTNAQSLPIQIEFVLRNIPFFVRKEDNILENDVLDNLLGVLRVRQAFHDKIEPTKDDAKRCFRAFYAFASFAQIEQFERALERSSSISQLLEGHVAYPGSNTGLTKFHEAIKSLRTRQNLLDAVVAIGKAFPGLKGVVGSIEDLAQGDVPLGEIVELASAYRGKPREFIDKIDGALSRAREMGSGMDQEHGVSLATYFRSKGLQWHTVLLTGCNQKIIPMVNAPLEEERRLFYVAMTRASSNLYVSYTKRSCGHAVEPSQFLKEAGFLTSDKSPTQQ
jgi:DNA helicase-2/ATP-dependent DNA helicase PcrA